MSAKTLNSNISSASTKKLHVETLSSKPNVPVITESQIGNNGTILVKYDYPCPYTGPTSFRLKIECQADSSCSNNHLDNTQIRNVQEGSIMVKLYQKSS